jgi:peptidoglycan hydrolase CwlO-like protein
LIQDLQLFGYTLEDIKAFSDSVRTFLAFQADLSSLPEAAVEAKLESMLKEIQELFDKMKLFKEGIARWEDLLKKGKRDIQSLKKKNQKRAVRTKGDAGA